MENVDTQYYSFEEICLATDLPSQTIIEIVELGIIQPEGKHPQNWVFSAHMITITKRACRLHQDLEIDWPGIALAIDLIDQLDQLRMQNRQLHNRLDRFCPESDTST